MYHSLYLLCITHCIYIYVCIYIYIYIYIYSYCNLLCPERVSAFQLPSVPKIGDVESGVFCCIHICVVFLQ